MDKIFLTEHIMKAKAKKRLMERRDWLTHSKLYLALIYSNQYYEIIVSLRSRNRHHYSKKIIHKSQKNPT